MTISDIRVLKSELEEKINKLIVDFNGKTQTPVQNIDLNIDRVSSIYGVDTYLYKTKIEVKI